VHIDHASLAHLRQRTSAKWRAYPDDVLPAWVAEMDFALAEPIATALHAAVDRSDTGYRWADEVPEALSEFALAEWNWQVPVDNVIVLADVMSSIAQSLIRLTEPGSEVVINPPVYPPFFSTVEKVCERTVREVPLARTGNSGEERYRLDLDGLEHAFADPAVQAYVLCSPHNPTGTVHSPDELRRVADLAATHGVLVVSDEIHAPLTLPDAAHTPFLKVAADDSNMRAVAAVSASKTWNIPGLKCAQLVAGDAVLDDLRDGIPIEATYGVGHFGVLGTLAAYRDGGPWREVMLATLDDRRRLLFDSLEAIPGVRMTWPEASYLAWVRFDGLGEDPALALLDQAKVALNSGPAFGSQGAAHARINYATTRKNLESVIEGIGSVAVGDAS